jgi:hypothetical protein
MPFDTVVLLKTPWPAGNAPEGIPSTFNASNHTPLHVSMVLSATLPLTVELLRGLLMTTQGEGVAVAVGVGLAARTGEAPPTISVTTVVIANASLFKQTSSFTAFPHDRLMPPSMTKSSKFWDAATRRWLKHEETGNVQSASVNDRHIIKSNALFIYDAAGCQTIRL